MTARCVMVLGTTSGAGKSWLTTALCRWYARQGLKVAPFKAQNMSNNARVVASTTASTVASTYLPHIPSKQLNPLSSAGEIGSAQYFQALAARAEPDVRMNPVLLKPEADTHSQVVLLGQVDQALTQMPWRERSAHVWPHIATALDALCAENDVVVIEGAGSPAEINLMQSDIVNMRVARHAKAKCLLVTDIDRGGAFAHLYGTWALLPKDDQACIHGFVLNKFRGDPSLLAPAPEQLQALTGIPTVAVLPMWWQHGLPEEDGVFDERSHILNGSVFGASESVTRTVAVLAYPRISNLDEFQALKNVPGIRLLWARNPADVSHLSANDWIILPGSKRTSSDLAWLRAQGLDRAVTQHAAKGGAVLGICGGLQMLGESLRDPHNVDGNAKGLGLLPLVTTFAPDKTVQRSTVQFGQLSGQLCGLWGTLSGVTMRGYEIHHGQTEVRIDDQRNTASLQGAHEVIPHLAWQNAAGNVLGIYMHGMFEDPNALRALLGITAPTLDSVFEGLADYVQTHIGADVLNALIDVSSPIPPNPSMS